MRVINQSVVSDVIKQTWHKNRKKSNTFCCFWPVADGSARKSDRFMVRERAPATLWREKNNCFQSNSKVKISRLNLKCNKTRVKSLFYHTSVKHVEEMLHTYIYILCV